MADFTAWLKSMAGRYIDVDGWAGHQCWDLSQAWLTACNGGTLWTQPSRFPGLAAGSWEVATGTGTAADDLRRHVTVHPGTERGRPGDLVIWAYGSPDYPISHTAVLIEDRGPILSTLSQNSSPARPDLPGYSTESSGPSIYQDLPRAGLLGFLRPRASISTQGSAFNPITDKDFDMASVDEVAEAIMRYEVDRSDGKGKITMLQFLRYYSGDIASIVENVKPINTSEGPLGLRQAVANAMRAAQAAAANTGPIKRGGKLVSLRQEVANILTKVLGLEPIIVETNAVVTASDVDGGKK